MRHSFWLLVLIGVAVETALAIFAYRTVAATLPCRWAGASVFGMHQSASCLNSVPVVGMHSLVLPLVVIGIAVSSVALGGAYIVRQLLRTRHARTRLGLVLRDVPVPDVLKDHIPSARFVLVESGSSFAFCYGALRPRIVLSTGILGALPPEQIKAVILHEWEHIVRHDPLRILVVGLATRVLFFIPTIGDLGRNARIAAEVRADEKAVRSCGRTAVVAGLLSMLQGGVDIPEAAAGMTTLGSLDHRVRVLEGAALGPVVVRRSRTAVSAIAVVVIIALVVLSPRPIKTTYYVPAYPTPNGTAIPEP